ncbi:hypothetical protein, partial [Escherichia coli]|uniref:hypothetical protein n=1 Tax=Escherichia coli TaxID=562 RepID=UPI00142AD32C
LEDMQADMDAMKKAHLAAAKKGNHVPKYEDEKYRQFDRDTGAEILKLIYDGGVCLPLKDDSEFLKDGLFCEWAYCVDLDARTVEVYHGDTTPAMIIPFAKFTVFSMRAVEKILRAE